MLPEALPYHLKVRDHFKQQATTWEFFAAARTREEQLIAFQTELLKNTWQFSRETDTALYEKIDLARERLGLGSISVTAYQAQPANDPGLNASLVYLHQEVHLVFSGPLLERLNEQEQLAVIAHELTRVRLYTLLEGELEVADRIVSAIANSDRSEAAGVSVTPFYETARLFRLYTEIFCDRGAYAVMGDAGPVVSSLEKIAAGLSDVNAPDTQPVTPVHPENFIRAQALRLWQGEQEEGGQRPAGSEGEGAGKGTPAEEAITQMIEKKPELDRLDLFAQQDLSDLTRLFLQEYLRPQWFQSTLVTGLAKQYFPDIVLGGPESGQATLIDAIAGAHPSIRDYLAYVLLDFVLADPSLEDMPAGRAFEFAGEMQLTAVYEPICKKELQLSDKKWQQHKQRVLEACHISYGKQPRPI